MNIDPNNHKADAMKKGSKITLIIAIVAIIVALCALGYAIYSHSGGSGNGDHTNPSTGATTAPDTTTTTIPDSTPTSTPYLYTIAVVVGTRPSIEMKESADIDSATITTISDRAEVVTLTKADDWWFVEFDGEQGWCQSKNLVDKAEYVDLSFVSVSTSGASVKMFAQADASADVIAEIPNLTTFRVARQIEGWSYVVYGGNLGWCRTSDIINSNNCLYKDAVATPADSSVAMMSSADASGEIICNIPDGESVTIIRAIDNWWFVKYGDKSGWCCGDEFTVVH